MLTAVETRSSSPVRILRDENYESNIRGLYPCGEGAGYAGRHPVGSGRRHGARLKNFGRYMKMRKIAVMEDFLTKAHMEKLRARGGAAGLRGGLLPEERPAG